MNYQRRRPVPLGWGYAYKVEAGKRMRALREEAGLTQAALARRAGISPATLCFIERGETLPLPATQQALADALEMDVRALIVRLTGDPHAR